MAATATTDNWFGSNLHEKTSRLFQVSTEKMPFLPPDQLCQDHYDGAAVEKFGLKIPSFYENNDETLLGSLVCTFSI